jgi:hypothetical protein
MLAEHIFLAAVAQTPHRSAKLSLADEAVQIHAEILLYLPVLLGHVRSPG